MERKVVCIHPADKTPADRQLAARKMYEILMRSAERKAAEQEKAAGCEK